MPIFLAYEKAVRYHAPQYGAFNIFGRKVFFFQSEHWVFAFQPNMGYLLPQITFNDG